VGRDAGLGPAGRGPASFRPGASPRAPPRPDRGGALGSCAHLMERDRTSVASFIFPWKFPRVFFPGEIRFEKRLGAVLDLRLVHQPSAPSFVSASSPALQSSHPDPHPRTQGTGPAAAPAAAAPSAVRSAPGSSPHARAHLVDEGRLPALDGGGGGGAQLLKLRNLDTRHPRRPCGVSRSGRCGQSRPPLRRRGKGHAESAFEGRREQPAARTARRRERRAG